jgi:hypothetical protein
LATKSSEDTLRVFKEVLQDIEDVCADDLSDAGKLILCSIQNTMSDHAATEVKFNKLLEIFINEVHELMRNSPGGLQGGDGVLVIKLSNYFCGIHSLVHYAECADKAGSEAEKGHFEGSAAPIFNPQFQVSGESGAARLVRTTCKALARGADEKSGIYAKAVPFLRPILKEKFSARSFPLTPYRGNRFNIMFHNASIIYCLHDPFIELLLMNQR